MNVKRTREWKAAEWDYCAIQASLQMPALMGMPTKAEIIEGLRGIVRRCPQFYPAVLELGLRLLSTKGDKVSERTIEKGLRFMLELAEPKHFAEEIDALIANLERLWRFDVSRCLLESIATCGRLSATLHDYLAYAAARLGDLEAAQRHIGEALRLKPRSKTYWSNKGWYHLMAGELEEAAGALEKARKLDPEDPVVLGNLEVLRYVSSHGGDYSDFLERPLDRKKLDRWADQEKWEEVESLRTNFNDCRMEAFVHWMFVQGGEKRWKLPRLIEAIRGFFSFVERVDSSGCFLNEDIGLVQRHFKSIMHKFIFRFRDLDHETMADVFEALTAYYGFLADRKLEGVAEFRQLRSTIQGLRGELVSKMERYNAIRHDPSMDEEQKEALREALFEGDHAWPQI